MRKELTYTITTKDDGLMVKAVLSKRLHLSRREISRLKFSDGLLLNDTPCRVTETVHTGDVIHLIFMEKDTAHAVRLSGKPDILYEDEDLVVVNKPAGMPCHPSHEHLDDDMGTLLQNYYKDQFTIRAIGRLDKDVSGIMLYAKNQPSAARLSKERQDGRLNKYYLAICSGSFQQKCGTLQYALEKKTKATMFLFCRYTSLPAGHTKSVPAWHGRSIPFLVISYMAEIWRSYIVRHCIVHTWNWNSLLPVRLYT